MAASDVEICNQALRLLGAQEISTLADSTDRARVCSRLYGNFKKTCLALHPWRFTIKRAQLSATTAPVNRYTYAFSAPGDALAGTGPLALFNSVGQDATPEIEWEWTAGVIETNFTPCYADYQFAPAETAWPPLFEDFVIHAFAAMIADPIQDRADKAEYWRAIAYGTPQENMNGGKLGEAKRGLARYRPPKPINQSGGPLIEARFGGG